MRSWEEFVPAEERAVYEKAGYGSQQAKVGSCPALLIIDVAAGVLGGMTQEEKIDFSVVCSGAWEAAKHISTLLEHFRRKGLPVVYTKPADGDIFGRATKRPVNNTDQDPRRNMIPEVIAPRAGELVVEKPRASAFFETPLATYLRRMQVDTIFVSGVSTSGCVRATVIDAFSHDFQTMVVEEAVFDRARTLHLANLFDMNAKYAEVITMEQALTLLGGVERL